MQRAVLGHVGDDETRTALLVKAFQNGPQISPVGLPAAATQPVMPVDDFHVKPDRHLVAMIGDCVGAPLGVFQCGGAEVDPGAAGRERSRQRLFVADTAGQLHGNVELADDFGEQFAVRPAAERGIEVHEMDPLGTVTLPGHGGVQRGAVFGFAARLPLHKPHRLAVHHVDGGQKNQLHGGQPSVFTGPTPNWQAMSRLRHRSSRGETG